MSRRLKANAAAKIRFRSRLIRGAGRWLPRDCAALLALLLTAACTSIGNNPVQRSFAWFNMLNGSDIRKACAPGAGERYRFVYNAVWGEQVRVYEIATPPGGGPATLTARVMFPETLDAIDLRDPLLLYRGKVGSVALSVDEMAALAGRLRQSGYYEAPPAGLTLPSDGFYWAISSCEG